MKHLGLRTRPRLLDAPLTPAPWHGPAMVLRMAETLIEAHAIERAAAVRCLRKRGFFAADINRLVDQACETAAAVLQSMAAR